MNLTARTYAPRAGSVPARVIQFFAANRGESMASADIAVKFDTPAATVANLLKSALDANFLGRENGFWCAGDDIDEAPNFGAMAATERTIASAATSSGAHNPFAAASATAKAARAAQSKAAPIAPDLSQLQVDSGIELVGRFKKENVWEPVFAVLTAPGVSAVIEPEWRKSLKVEATKRQRAQQGSWQIGIDAQGKTRILRTA